MYQILLTLWQRNMNGGVALHTQVLRFDTEKQADVAYQKLLNPERRSLTNPDRTVEKLY